MSKLSLQRQNFFMRFGKDPLREVKKFDSTVIVVLSPALIQEFKNQVNKLCGITQKNERFPGNMPFALNWQSAQQIKESRYLVTPKADGMRYFLLFTTIDGNEYQVLIDRSWGMFLLKLRVDKEIYKGTLLDGEVLQAEAKTSQVSAEDVQPPQVKTETACKQYLFLAFDAIASCGQCMDKWSQESRIKTMGKITTGIASPEGAPIQIRCKTFDTSARRVAEMKFDYETDGLIFVPRDRHMVLFKDDQSFKWKEVHTADFLVYINDEVHLCALDGKEMKRFARQRIEDTFKLEENEVTAAEAHKNIVEFYYADDLWIPYRLRKDKALPNPAVIAQKTLETARLAITLPDLLKFLE